MNETEIYSITDLNSPPAKLQRREDGNSHYQFIPLPLPDQIFIFTLGDWTKSQQCIEATITYKDEPLQLGKITRNQRCLCWERRMMKKGSSNVFSSEQNGLAKLVLEVQNRQTSLESADDSIIKQEENEDTPKVHVNHNNEENNKPVKQKRRSSLTKSDQTPTGPSSKKPKTRTRNLKTKLNSSVTEVNMEEKENISQTRIPSPLKLSLSPSSKPIVTSKPTLATCKDVTSRAPHPSSRWGHSFCMVHDNMGVLIGGQGERQQTSKDSVWSLDPVTRKWRDQEITSEIPNQKPEYRMGHTATYDPTLRCVYVYGGSKNLKWFHDVHMLDVDEFKWQLLKVAGKAPTRAYHSATLYRNELWIFGGVYPRPDPQPDGCSNEVHIFSPVLENWYAPIVNGEKPLPRSGHSATLIDDQLVMFGGWDAPYCYNDLYILDMSIVEWAKPKVNGTPPSPRSWHASCALKGNRIMIHGGYDGDLALDDLHIFTLATSSWMKIKLEPSPIPRAGHQAICLPYNHENEEQDEVLIFGGGNNDGNFFHDLLSANIPFNPIEDQTVLTDAIQNS
ncbi:uncharacterized protein LOC134701461 [Mytilus trossulus]|uniref:uncharacterized protein LOC134701461 n=1 Tax=Mytilus trossulus TaxID=6551 RepID=UPI003007B5F1